MYSTSTTCWRSPQTLNMPGGFSLLYFLSCFQYVIRYFPCYPSLSIDANFVLNLSENVFLILTKCVKGYDMPFVKLHPEFPKLGVSRCLQLLTGLLSQWLFCKIPINMPLPCRPLQFHKFTASVCCPVAYRSDFFGCPFLICCSLLALMLLS